MTVTAVAILTVLMAVVVVVVAVAVVVVVVVILVVGAMVVIAVVLDAAAVVVLVVVVVTVIVAVVVIVVVVDAVLVGDCSAANWGLSLTSPLGRTFGGACCLRVSSRPVARLRAHRPPGMSFRPHPPHILVLLMRCLQLGPPRKTASRATRLAVVVMVIVLVVAVSMPVVLVTLVVLPRVVRGLCRRAPPSVERSPSRKGPGPPVGVPVVAVPSPV